MKIIISALVLALLLSAATSTVTRGQTNPAAGTAAAADDPLAELETWNRVKKSNRALDYHSYLLKYPNGAFSRQAREKMLAVGDPIWNEVKKSSDPFVFRDYIRKNPTSPFLDLAKARMKDLTETAIAWEKVKDTDDPDVLMEFVNENRDHPNAAEAKRLAGALTWAKISTGTDPSDFKDFAEKYPDDSKAKDAKLRERDLTWEAIKDRRDYRQFVDYLEKFPDAPNAADIKKIIGPLQLEHEGNLLQAYNKRKFSLGNFGEGWNELSGTVGCAFKRTTYFGWNDASGGDPVKWESPFDLRDIADVTVTTSNYQDGRPSLYFIRVKLLSGKKTVWYGTTYTRSPMWGRIKDKIKDEEPGDPWVAGFDSEYAANDFASHLKHAVAICRAGKDRVTQ